MSKKFHKFNPVGNSAESPIKGSDPLEHPVDASEVSAHKSKEPSYTAHRTGAPPRFPNKGVKGVSGLKQR